MDKCKHELNLLGFFGSFLIHECTKCTQCRATDRDGRTLWFDAPQSELSKKIGKMMGEALRKKQYEDLWDRRKECLI